jgi:hypothetical protein
MELKSEVVPVSALDEALVQEMYALFENYYDAVSESLFRADLGGKDEVVLLRQGTMLKGFSTMQWNPAGLALAEGDILFSGDTIIAKDAWGGQSLVRAFCRRAGQWSRTRGKPLYWLLISKGHRTYLYLPLFGRRFYPDPSGTCKDLRKIADDASRQVFGAAFDPASGLVRFAEPRGQLKAALAADTTTRAGNRFVDFFLQRNPEYSEGVELVGLMELSAANLKSVARSAFIEGYISV